ncbi:hypothetical protein [Staphylococcus agnetis]|uniref:hypothetical protein n=1 Tax=Staphylococcus agnetis TaxID=985762 RepID=UPI0021D0541B|nr:hypothetical protein [Staphylococcus agnetis]UXU59030.1 hypothetical protein MUA97_09060 [Staphylococcus agnetis]UXU61356.1 hypothetical protein MUA43_09060 [Staphylococcus agnetis]
MLQKLKIALLIVILAEEIRNARNYKKAIGKPFKVKLDVDTSEVVENIQKLKRSLK